MTRLTQILASGAAALALFAAAGPAAAQEDCPRGDLDERFCDRDGDLVADIPTDPAQLLDPDPLIFAYTPVEDPAVYKTAWAPFLDFLADFIQHAFGPGRCKLTAQICRLHGVTKGCDIGFINLHTLLFEKGDKVDLFLQLRLTACFGGGIRCGLNGGLLLGG